MTPLLDPFPIRPFTNRVSGEVTLPGSKSITNRALLLASLCKKPVTLRGALFSEDTQIMAKALNDLGFEVTLDESAGTMKIAGQNNAYKNIDRVELFVGNAGTAARFLTALCAAAPRGIYQLGGIPQMHHRPMKGLIDALRTLGADIRCLITEGFLPIEIHAKGLRGGNVTIDASESSQMLSGLLMVMPLATESCEVFRTKPVREPFVNMTLLMMRKFGFNAGFKSENESFSIMPCDPPRGSLVQTGGDYLIEADASSASYFLALPVVNKGSLSLLNMPFPDQDSKENLQGDGYNFIKVMQDLGAEIRPYVQPRSRSMLSNLFSLMFGLSDQSKSTSKSGGITVSFNHSSRSQGVTREFRDFSDTFLTLAAITPLLRAKKTTISGIAHTRKQETDRINAAASQLRKIVGDKNVTESEDSLEVTPLHISTLKKQIAKMKEPIVIDTYNDHRIAMSFAILGTYDLKKNGKPWINIKNPGCCAKTFPHFFNVLEQVRQDSHQ